MLEARRFFKCDQVWLAQRLCQPCWEWVLEEAWLREDLPPVNLFGEQREDWLKASWIAPGWGWVDPVKEVNSSKLAIEGRLSTLADECAAQGRDWEDVLAQQKREQDRRQELGLLDPVAPTGAAAIVAPAPAAPGTDPAEDPAMDPAEDYAETDA